MSDIDEGREGNSGAPSGETGAGGEDEVTGRDSTGTARLSEGGGAGLYDEHETPPGTKEEPDEPAFQWKGDVAAIEVTAARDLARQDAQDRASELSPEPPTATPTTLARTPGEAGRAQTASADGAAADGVAADGVAEQGLAGPANEVTTPGETTSNGSATADGGAGAARGPAARGGSILGRLRSVLSTQIDRADERREAERSSTMRYDAPVSSRPQASAPAPSATRVIAPEGITVRDAALQSLPRWLVRGGLGAWLLLGLIIIVALVFVATAHVVPVFIGVFLALVVTAILHPIVELFARVMPRYPATFLGLLVALAVVAGLITYVVTSVTSQWSTLTTQFSDGINTILDFIEHGPLPVHLSQQDLVAQVQRTVGEAQAYIQTNAPSLASEVLANAGTVADVFVVLALALFTTIFFLASGGRMWRWFLNELPAQMRERVHRAAGAGWYTFAGYARGTVILAGTDAVMAGVFLQIVGVPLAAPLAVLVFIGAFVPLIGAPTAMIVAMIVALAAKGFVAMVVVGLGVAGIGQIEGHILQPLIMGRQVSLHPVVVIIAVAVGTFSMGLLGAIIAVPLVSVAWSVYSELHVKDAPVVGELPAYNADHNV